MKNNNMLHVAKFSTIALSVSLFYASFGVGAGGGGAIDVLVFSATALLLLPLVVVVVVGVVTPGALVRLLAVACGGARYATTSPPASSSLRLISQVPWTIPTAIAP
jgi:hypothetical protein